MAGTSVRAGGTWRTTQPYVKDGGVWKRATGLWVKDAGAWKQTFGLGTVTKLGENFTTTAGAKSFVTPALAIGDVLVALVISTTASLGSIVLSDNQGGTWQTPIGATVGSTTRCIGLALRYQKVAAAVAHTVTYTPPAGDTGGGLAVFKVSGLSDVFSFRQRATVNDGAAGALSIPLTFAGRPQNSMIGGVVAGSLLTSPAAPSGWVQDLNTAFATPTTSYFAGHIDSNETASTITFGGSSNIGWCGVVGELMGWA